MSNDSPDTQETYTREQREEAHRVFKTFTDLYDLPAFDLQKLLGVTPGEYYQLRIGKIVTPEAAQKLELLTALVVCYPTINKPIAVCRKVEKALKENGLRLFCSDGSFNNLLERELGGKDTQIASLQEELRLAERARNNLSEENATLLGRYQHAREKANADRQEAIGYQGDLEEAQNRLEQVKEELKNTKTSLATYKGGYEELVGIEDRLRKSIEKVTADRDAAVKDSVSYANRLADLQNELLETDSERRELAMQLEDYDALKTRLNLAQAQSKLMLVASETPPGIKKTERVYTQEELEEAVQAAHTNAGWGFSQQDIEKAVDAAAKVRAHKEAEKSAFAEAMSDARQEDKEAIARLLETITPSTKMFEPVTTHYVEELEKRIAQLERQEQQNQGNQRNCFDRLQTVESQQTWAKGALESLVSLSDSRLNHLETQAAHLEEQAKESGKSRNLLSKNGQELEGRLVKIETWLKDFRYEFKGQSFGFLAGVLNSLKSHEDRFDRLNAVVEDLERSDRTAIEVADILVRQNKDSSEKLQGFLEKLHAVENRQLTITHTIEDLRESVGSVGQAGTPLHYLAGVPEVFDGLWAQLGSLIAELGDQDKPGTHLGYLSSIPTVIDALAARVGEIESHLKPSDPDFPSVTEELDWDKASADSVTKCQKAIERIKDELTKQSEVLQRFEHDKAEINSIHRLQGLVRDIEKAQGERIRRLEEKTGFKFVGEDNQ